jgi:hypothetical protein
MRDKCQNESQTVRNQNFPLIIVSHNKVLTLQVLGKEKINKIKEATKWESNSVFILALHIYLVNTQVKYVFHVHPSFIFPTITL